jgi:hypothetical protein
MFSISNSDNNNNDAKSIMGIPISMTGNTTSLNSSGMCDALMIRGLSLKYL